MYRVEIIIKQETLDLVLADLKIADNPPTITTNEQDVSAWQGKKGFHSEEWGHYDSAENHIALQTLPHSYQRLPLFRLVPRIRETLLHELRHAHQHQTWDEHRKARMHDGGYWKCDCEVDARKWAYAAANKRAEFKDLVAVTRIPQGKAVVLP